MASSLPGTQTKPPIHHAARAAVLSTRSPQRVLSQFILLFLMLTLVGAQHCCAPVATTSTIRTPRTNAPASTRPQADPAPRPHANGSNPAASLYLRHSCPW